VLDLHSPTQWLRWIGRSAKRVAVLLLGTAVLAAGVAMLALPGPGVLVLLVGLAILATEFAWAERALDRAASSAAGAAASVTGRRSGRIALAASGIGMVIGGLAVVGTLDAGRVAGASVALAGLVGLCTLAPPVQRWIERTATRPTPPTSPSDATAQTATTQIATTEIPTPGIPTTER
jgi:uncharacterized protein (TIGR02611 family)